MVGRAAGSAAVMEVVSVAKEEVSAEMPEALLPASEKQTPELELVMQVLLLAWARKQVCSAHHQQEAHKDKCWEVVLAWVAVPLAYFWFSALSLAWGSYPTEAQWVCTLASQRAWGGALVARRAGPSLESPAWAGDWVVPVVASASPASSSRA